MNFLILPGQFRLVLCLCYAGMASACMYDFLYPFRKVSGLRQISDLVFGLATGLFYFSALFYCREEKLRLMGLFFFLTGFGLYRMGPGQLIRFCFHRISGRKKAGQRRNETG